jgi:predicted HicB family RNase H-like nuclease
MSTQQQEGVMADDDKQPQHEEHETEQVNLRIAPSRLEVWRQHAKKDRRTLSNWIKHVIEAQIDKP